MGEWAEASGKGDEFHEAAFASYFVHGENIGDPAVLLALAESVKLPVKSARKVLSLRSYREAVDAIWERARQRMITAVPTLIMGRGRLVGAQTYDVLRQFVMDNSNRR
jgi:predicted DsbA family dithiol-disulfide isomerase